MVGGSSRVTESRDYSLVRSGWHACCTCMCVSDVMESLTVWEHKKPKTKNHVEHHTASAPPCRGADDQRCVEMIK